MSEQVYTHTAATTLTIVQWDEENWDQRGEHKLALASVVYNYSGALSGEGKARFLITYQSDESATFVGYQRFIGSLENEEGSFVLQHEGRFEAGIVHDLGAVLAGSGEGACEGIVGELPLDAGHQETFPLTFMYRRSG